MNGFDRREVPRSDLCPKSRRRENAKEHGEQGGFLGTISSVLHDQPNSISPQGSSHTHLAGRKVGQVIGSFFVGICKQTARQV